MSSASRSPSEVARSSRYFLAIDTTTYYIPDDGVVFPGIMLESDFQNRISEGTGAPSSSSSLYRDLGRQVTTTVGSAHVSIYRLVQRMNGSTTEGISGDYDFGVFYIRTWGADPAVYPITVARVG